MIDVTRLGKSDYRMQQEQAISFLKSAARQLFMRAMKWITSLKRDDVLMR
jgi:hypothetical protein